MGSYEYLPDSGLQSYHKEHMSNAKESNYEHLQYGILQKCIEVICDIKDKPC